jgi:predicted transcriptional regulator
MPKLNSSRVHDRIAELDLSVEELAARTAIPHGTLRNAVAGRDPMRLRRIYRVLGALNPPGRKPIELAEIVVPDAQDVAA